MRLRLLAPVFVVGVTGLIGCSTSESPSPTGPNGPISSSVDDPCGEVTTVRLLAGQTLESGSVIVQNDGEELCVRFETSGDWRLFETHLDIRLTLGDIPQTRIGSPKVGKFSYSHDLSGAAVDEFCFSLAELGYTSGMDLVIAAHAVVERIVDGQSVQEETAWGEGPEFPGNSWAMYLNHTVQECNEDPPFNEGEFTTVPQSEWAEACDGSSSASCYLIEHWTECFGDEESASLIVGCAIGGQSITFTSPDAIQAYLPVFGPPFALLGNYFNPGVIEDEEGGFHEGGEGGELIGQIVALTLALQFDSCAPAFGQSDTWLGELIVCSPDSPFSGWSIPEVLEEANLALGGCASGGFTLEELTTALAAINQTFVSGQPVGSYVCERPGGPE